MKAKTFIVFGNFRGGTTMVAKCLTNMGVCMGKTLDHGNYEDKEFQHADPRKIIELIKKRSNEYDVWGWKFPDSIKNVDRFENHLRNPHFICIFRDPLAIALSENARTGQEVSRIISTANQRNKKMIEFIQSTEYKTLMLSYEHCITRQEEFAKTLTKFVGIGTEETVIEAINPTYGGKEFTYSATE